MSNLEAMSPEDLDRWRSKHWREPKDKTREQIENDVRFLEWLMEFAIACEEAISEAERREVYLNHKYLCEVLET